MLIILRPSREDSSIAYECHFKKNCTYNPYTFHAMSTSLLHGISHLTHTVSLDLMYSATTQGLGLLYKCPFFML